MLQSIFLTMFVLFSLLHLLGEAMKKLPVRYATKPFLLVSLAAYYCVSADTINWMMTGAILCGWLGDIFLMIPDPEKTRKYFKPGLAAFLLGHVLYTVVFAASFSGCDVFPSLGWGLFLPYILMGAAGFLLVKPHAGKLLGAFAAYVIIIVIMGFSTVLPLGGVTFKGVSFAMAGSFIFIISDTLNGYNKFAREIPNERIYTMSTYLVGQFLLVYGYLHF